MQINSIQNFICCCVGDNTYLYRKTYFITGGCLNNLLSLLKLASPALSNWVKNSREYLILNEASGANWNRDKTIYINIQYISCILSQTVLV